MYITCSLLTSGSSDMHADLILQWEDYTVGGNLPVDSN